MPWGKHTPPGNDEYRLEHKSLKDKDVDANMIIPAVTVRDPYYWMQVCFDLRTVQYGCVATGKANGSTSFSSLSPCASIITQQAGDPVTDVLT